MGRPTAPRDLPWFAVGTAGEGCIYSKLKWAKSNTVCPFGRTRAVMTGSWPPRRAWSTFLSNRKCLDVVNTWCTNDFLTVRNFKSTVLTFFSVLFSYKSASLLLRPATWCYLGISAVRVMRVLLMYCVGALSFRLSNWSVPSPSSCSTSLPSHPWLECPVIFQIGSALKINRGTLKSSILWRSEVVFF